MKALAIEKQVTFERSRTLNLTPETQAMLEEKMKRMIQCASAISAKFRDQITKIWTLKREPQWNKAKDMINSGKVSRSSRRWKN